jgi:cytochrome c nitrite reductase small subunit
MDPPPSRVGRAHSATILPRRIRGRLVAWLGLSLAVVLGSALGLGSYTFYYAQGASYFSNNSANCANCHIMRPQYHAWAQSSHHAVATCNDCHAPHDSMAAKLYVKGVNGFRHSWAFTTGDFNEPIRITDFNRRVTERSCRHCHSELAYMIDFNGAADHGLESVSCIRCHNGVGHR